MLPDFGVELIGTNPPYKLVRNAANQLIGDVSQLSSGEAQIFSLGLDIATIAAIWELQNAETRLLFIDEPDAHVHPDLQARFADFLVQVASRFELQVVIATHSTTLLAALGQFAGDDCGAIYIDRTKASFSAEGFSAATKELTACLGGHVLMGPLFGIPTLLVEGDDDYRIWSQVPRHDVVSFSVIPSNGEEIYKYQASLEKILASLRDNRGPAGFALLDRDKRLPGENVPQAQIKFIRLNCREAENLYLADEVLSVIGTDWPTATAAIVAAAPRHGTKQTKLTNAAIWNRQMDDLKDVINEVALAIDTRPVHWTQRVGVAIGREKPAGQLAEFLGAAVMNSLWA